MQNMKIHCMPFYILVSFSTHFLCSYMWISKVSINHDTFKHIYFFYVDQISNIFQKITMIPPRCFTCNSLVANKFAQFMEQKDDSGHYGGLLDELGMRRICCRRMFLTHVEIVDEISKYSCVSAILDDSRTVFDSFVKNEREVSCD